MNYFPGYPVKKPKQKEIDSSGTEGTQMSQFFNGSGNTPTFHNLSDDEFFDSPRFPKQQKEQKPSTQDFMQELINQNQNVTPNNGLFASFFSFGDRGQRDFGNTFSESSFGSNQPDNYQYKNYSEEEVCFNGNKNARGPNLFDDSQNNWSKTISLKNPEFGENETTVLHQEKPSFYQKLQESEKRQGSNVLRKINRIGNGQLQNINDSTIFEIRQEFEGLTNPIDGQSQSNSQNAVKVNTYDQTAHYQSNKKSVADNEKLRQSIIEVLSNMDSSESSKKESPKKQNFGFRKTANDEEDNDTIIDSLSDLVFSPSKNIKPMRAEKVMIMPLAGSEKKGQTQVKFFEHSHLNSTKTHFELRNQHNFKFNALVKKNQDPLGPNIKQSFWKQSNNQGHFSKRQNSRLKNERDQTQSHQKNFTESKVAEINLENLKSLGIGKQKTENKIIQKSQDKKSFFKNKPFDLLNQRKNNLMTKESLQQSKKAEKKGQANSRRLLLHSFVPNCQRNSKESDKIEQFSSNPLPIDDDEEFSSRSFPTQAFEYYSQSIDPSKQQQTKPVSSEIAGSKFGMFAKRNRDLNAKKPQEENKVENISFNLIQNKKKSPIVDSSRKIQQKLQIQKFSTNQNEDKLRKQPIILKFTRKNTEKSIQMPKAQIKKEQKLSANTNLGKNNESQKIMFKFDRRKVQSKASKVSFSSINSEASSNGPDMKGIFEKVNEKKQNGHKNMKENPIPQQKPKFNFDFKNKKKIQSFKASNVGQEKKEFINYGRQSNQNQKTTNGKNKSSDASSLNGFRFKRNEFPSQRVEAKQLSDKHQALTVEKDRHRLNSTIPKYIFSKKTPPKKLSKQIQKSEMKIVFPFDNFEKNNAEMQKSQKSQNAFESKKKPEIQFKRSNYMIQKEKEGFKFETDSKKDNYWNKRSESPSFPSIESNSTRSELIKEVENLMELATQAKIRMRRQKEESDEYLQKSIDLKRKVEYLFPEERIKKLMDWKYL